MIVGLNLFHFVALTPTNLNECPEARLTAALAEPLSIDSPDAGNISIVTEVSFNISIINPAAVSGSFTPSAEVAVALVTMFIVLVSAVAPD